jgi:hypothetical protein
MRTPENLTGREFGKLTAIEYAGASQWHCRCACGAETLVYASNLKTGRSTSCGKCKSTLPISDRVRQLRAEMQGVAGYGDVDYTAREGWPRTYVRIYFHPYSSPLHKFKGTYPYRAVCVWTDDAGRPLVASMPMVSRKLRAQFGDRVLSIEQAFLEHLQRAGHLPIRAPRQRIMDWIEQANVHVSTEQVGEGTTDPSAMLPLKAELTARGLWTASRDELRAKLELLPKRGPRIAKPAPARRPPPPPTRRPVAPPHPTGDDDPGCEDDIWALG